MFHLFEDKHSPLRIGLSIFLSALFFALAYYVFCPAWNIHCLSLFIILSVTLYVFLVISGFHQLVVPTLIAILALGFIFTAISTPLFRAKAYSHILTIEDGAIADIPSSEDTAHIALMDTSSATKLGDREIGSLTEIVSQFNVSANYTQINTGGFPMKVSALEYAGFFKWDNNRNVGIPGYVRVDPVKNEADYVSLEQGMIYVPSAYFWQDLIRHVRSIFPTKLFYEPHFEIDESYNPWYVVPTYQCTIGIYGGKQIDGAVLCNPVSGTASWYPVAQIPSWVDLVFDGDLICQHYNYAWSYLHGFWNSLIGQRDCRKVTTGDGVDYGYLAIDDDIWIYTGITSVNGDSSNIGFILSNQRTEQTKFIVCPGANEFSAMAAAQGEVQEKGYVASFPSLVKFGDELAYLMVLKDGAGLVKMYAAVSVEQYNLVAVTSVKNTTIDRFRQLLSGTSFEANANIEIIEDLWSTGRTAFLSNDKARSTLSVNFTRYDLVVINGETYVFLPFESDRALYSRYTDLLPEILHLSDSHSGSVSIETDGTYFVFADVAK